MGREIKKVGEGWQIWENVSEGSPVSEVFATEEELIEHLHKNGASGTFKPCSRAAAREFVKTGYAPTMAIFRGCFADGINAYSASLPPFLGGFDRLSDDILDLLGQDPDGEQFQQWETVIEKSNELLMQFRNRTEKFTKWVEATALIYYACNDTKEELPEAVMNAIKECDRIRDELYPPQPTE